MLPSSEPTYVGEALARRRGGLPSTYKWRAQLPMGERTFYPIVGGESNRPVGRFGTPIAETSG
jgi:hypothetical protein